MFKRLLFSLWSNDEIVITLKIYAARWWPSTPSSTQSSSWRPWWRWAQSPQCSCSRRSAQCSRRPGVCCQEWSEMFSTLEPAEPTKLSSCCEAVAVPSCQLSLLFSLLSREKPTSKGSRTGASLNLLPFLIPPSLFQDVEIQVLHRAMPSALNSSVSDECISSPMLREADAQLIPTGAQEDLDLQLVQPWRMITCILMLPSEVHSYPHPIPLFLQLLLLSTTIGDTS